MRALRAALLLPLVLIASPLPAEPAVVHVCEDAGGWPPFLYRARAGDVAKGEAAGLSVQIAEALFDELDRPWDITLLPWKRCLQEVESGKHYTMILNASFQPERAESYHYSRPYYRITPYYFFDRHTHPEGLEVRGVDDLKRYRIGGILGYNYSYANLNESDIQSAGIYNLEALLTRLHTQQFDLFVENVEIVAGHYLLRDDAEGWQALGMAPLPDAPPTAFHMLFSRSVAGTALYREADAALERLQNSGEIARLLQPLGRPSP